MTNGNNSMNVGTAIKAKAMNAVHGTVDFIKNPRKVAGLAMAGATLSLVTACSPSSTPETPVSPVPTPSNIDMPTIKPTTEMPSTQPSTQETNDSDNPCVGQNFSKTRDVLDCLNNYSGKKDANPTSRVDSDGDGIEDGWSIVSAGKYYVWLDTGTLVERDK